MFEALIKKSFAKLTAQDAMFRRLALTLPAGAWITPLVIFIIAGRYLWLNNNHPSHEKEITAAFGSVGLFYGLPQGSVDGEKVTFVATSDIGYGLFLADTVTGQKRNLIVEGGLGPSGDYYDLHVWPWAPDNSAFIYSSAGEIDVCNPDTGAIAAKLRTPAFVNDLIWITPTLFVCVGADGNLYQFEKGPSTNWHQKESPQNLNGFAPRAIENNISIIGSDKPNLNINENFVWSSTGMPAWLQYQFNGPAWAITQYTLTASTNDAELDPSAWQLLGSTDGNHWTMLDTRTNEVFASRRQTKRYAFSNQTPYWYYRLKVVASNGGRSTQLGKCQLWSEDTSCLATASAENVPNYAAYSAFDGLSETKWWNDNQGSSAWLQYEFGGGQGWAISRYSITSADNGPKRDPMAWQLQVSNDGDNWIDIDSRKGERFTDRLQTKSYAVANPLPYRFYRLNVTANQGGGREGVQLSELALEATRTDASGDSSLVNVAKNPFAGAFALTKLSSNSIAYAQGNKIWIRNLDSGSSGLVLDLQTFAPPNTTLLNFSYSKQNGHYLLSCSQEGKDVLWDWNPNKTSSGPDIISLPLPAHDVVALNHDGQYGWIGNGGKYLLFKEDSSSNPIRLLPSATIEAWTLTSDARHLLMFGTASNELSAGLWRYDFDTSQLQSVVAYADHPSTYATRRDHGDGSVRLPSGDNLNYEVFRPAHFDRLLRHKYPLVIGDTYFGNVVNGAHGRLWIPAIAANDAYVAIVNRRDWNNGIDHWGDDLMAVYKQLADNPSIDKSRVFLFGVSAETSYLSAFVAKSPGLWKGIILLNPTELPDFSKSSFIQQRPRILISAGSEEHKEGQFSEYQRDALKTGSLVELVISSGEAHHFVGNAAQLERAKAIEHFVFDE